MAAEESEVQQGTPGEYVFPKGKSVGDMLAAIGGKGLHSSASTHAELAVESLSALTDASTCRPRDGDDGDASSTTDTESITGSSGSSAGGRLDLRPADTPLHFAASIGCRDTLLSALRDLRSTGEAVDRRTAGGFTSLHVASRSGHIHAIELLLGSRADALAKTDDEQLPLHLAAAGGHFESVAVLLQHGGPEQGLQRNSTGQRPAHVSVDLATFLLLQPSEQAASSGKGAEFQDDYAGRKPHWESGTLRRNGRCDMVRKLLSHTARPCSAQPPVPHAESCPPQRRGCFVRTRHAAAAEPETLESFEVQRILGSGSFGRVLQARHRETGEVVALKAAEKTRVREAAQTAHVYGERNLLTFISHPYIASLRCAFQTESHFFLALELGCRGALDALVQGQPGGVLGEAEACLYTAELLLALGYLHLRGLAHRDLKPANVVVDAAGHVLLIDFGLAEGPGAQDTEDDPSALCGSLAFLAPEVLSQGAAVSGRLVDVYSLGVVLFFMLAGLPPFYSESPQKLISNIKSAPIQAPPCASRVAASLLGGLLQRQPRRRLGAADTQHVQLHPFFADVDWEALLRRQVEALRLPVAPDNVFSAPADGADATAVARVFGTTAQLSAAPDWDFGSIGPLSSCKA